MSLPTKQPWSTVKLEVLTPMLSRRVLTAEKAMIAQVYLKKGAIVKAHEHHNEQITYILEGGLRFWLGGSSGRCEEDRLFGWPRRRRGAFRSSAQPTGGWAYFARIGNPDG